MKLTRRAVRTYQYTVLFFSIVSLMLINHPTIFLIPIFVILTLTLYVLRGIREVRKLSGECFEVFVSISPNVLSIGDRSKVRVCVESKMEDRLKIEIYIPLSEGLKIDSGEANWSGVIDSKNNATLEFTVKVEKSGLLEVGPVIIIAKDNFELVCKDINMDSTRLIYSLEEPMRARSIVTAPLPIGFNYPGYTSHPFIGVNEQYRDSIQSNHSSLKNIDWRRTARAEGEEVYIKEYSKRRSSDIILGFGSGLNLDLPSYGNVLNWIVQVSISYALHYLREGSRIWILNYNDGRPVITQLNLRYGELTSRRDSTPTGGYLIYISRLIDPWELNSIKEYLNTQKFRVDILLIDLLDEVSDLVEDGVINYEAERLKQLVSDIQEPIRLVKLRDFISSFRRSLASR
ncbi:MAG: DUF58 domain-containing protein [Thaumarchaeota archaeon]|nr:DUF58 domain-containing protein [Candidatus Geocrenenecus arthurdayi]MCL7389882.1 DUF58 domain-containing protein [Candidatus Geocrenenecus arthurdayi]MCL7390529.1 DUF58 domain-containing protein [Candidatus Geocrenenecus arthurdayi]MCL7396535.1 DUF58 domain-containing protein [Candidatus Geocrenenecus arthurdayi]MCL7403261.1 DUF58 domain-containing protein [Candidatus Geocrenenecus arthurdayi]